ncbi:hypothetical protein PR048_004820 [Dryococelus australis]|uniref:Uncharacterized protein n=1 Tax=Dryococelus australis TaxID=614101 RepID=A0ABQ9I7K7_9NEOP|nr:hypothetical protein PR048_004820 [Dryococelus australis]
MKGPTLNPGETPSVRKYNVPSSDTVDAKSSDTITSNPQAVRYEARRRKASCYRKYCNGINKDTEHEVTVMDKDTLNENFYEPDESQVNSCNESDYIDGGEVDLSSRSQPGKKPEQYFIVAWSCLLALLKICHDCKN